MQINTGTLIDTTIKITNGNVTEVTPEGMDEWISVRLGRNVVTFQYDGVGWVIKCPTNVRVEQYDPNSPEAVEYGLIRLP